MTGRYDPETEAWIASYSADQVRAAIPKAIRARDFLAVEGLLKMLALKDPESAQEIYDALAIGASAKGSEPQ